MSDKKKKKGGFWKWLSDLLSKIKLGGNGTPRTKGDTEPSQPPPKPGG